MRYVGGEFKTLWKFWYSLEGLGCIGTLHCDFHVGEMPVEGLGDISAGITAHAVMQRGLEFELALHVVQNGEVKFTTLRPEGDGITLMGGLGVLDPIQEETEAVLYGIAVTIGEGGNGIGLAVVPPIDGFGVKVKAATYAGAEIDTGLKGGGGLCYKQCLRAVGMTIPCNGSKLEDSSVRLKREGLKVKGYIKMFHSQH